MKIIKTIFFHIYNAYYKDGNYSNDIPHLTAFGIVGCSMSFILTTLISYINFYLNQSKLPFEIVIAMLIIGLGLFFFLFIPNKKYQLIYEEIKGSKLDTTIVKIISWIFVIAGFVAVGLYAYLYNNPN